MRNCILGVGLALCGPGLVGGRPAGSPLPGEEALPINIWRGPQPLAIMGDAKIKGQRVSNPKGMIADA